jgi:hypothetical protein
MDLSMSLNYSVHIPCVLGILVTVNYRDSNYLIATPNDLLTLSKLEDQDSNYPIATHQ